MIGLVAGGLMAAMVPGVASANGPVGYETFKLCKGTGLQATAVYAGWPPSDTDELVKGYVNFCAIGSIGVRPVPAVRPIFDLEPYR